MEKDWDKNEVVTVYGKFKDGILTSDGHEVDCMTYGSFKDFNDGKQGFFNLKYNEPLKTWVIFQVVEALLSNS